MRDGRLEQFEIDDLSAWIDGELDAARSAEVERLVREAPAWTDACRQLKALDGLLENAAPAPAAPADLAERIIRNVGAPRRGVIYTFFRVAGAAAAAAVITLAVVHYYSTQTPRHDNTPVAATQDDKIVNQALKDVPKDDRFVVENLDFFRDYQVLVNLDTLEAMDRVDSGQGT